MDKTTFSGQKSSEILVWFIEDIKTTNPKQAKSITRKISSLISRYTNDVNNLAEALQGQKRQRDVLLGLLQQAKEKGIYINLRKRFGIGEYKSYHSHLNNILTGIYRKSLRKYGG